MEGSVVTYIRIKEAEKRPIFTHRRISIGNRPYQADGIFYGPEQDKLFSTVSRTILDKALQGYNCTVFAYGQTGSGKTYTIQGNDDFPGLIPRTLGFLYERCKIIKISFIEVYNESMLDLLAPSNQINIREDPNDGVVVDNLQILNCNSLKESLDLYSLGIQNKRSAATKMNENSSRSHTVFTIYLENKEQNLTKRSKLCFVDLAGSERLREGEPERAKETCNINKSLLCLGKIVNKLSSRERWHVSYRDSKLTFLLKDSLGGNCRLAIIGNICLDYETETINTLIFLRRTKMIRNNPSINYDISRYTPEELAEGLRLLGEENQELRNEIVRLKEDCTYGVGPSMLYSIENIKKEITDVKDRLEKFNNLFNGAIKQYFEVNRRKIVEIADKIGNSEDKENREIKRRKNGEEL